MSAGKDNSDGRLDRLDEKIDDLREGNLDRRGLDGDPKFIDDGSASDVVDNTIAPG